MGWLLAALLALPVLGLVYQQFGVVRDRRRYPPPGRIVNGLHVYPQGAGDRDIVLESGVAATSLSWQRLQPKLAEFARTFSYDRAGLGWSARPRAARTLLNLMEELHDWLRASDVRLPCLFVGHSFGGLLLRHYVAAYPRDVAGLVLLDPLVPSEWNPFTAEQRYRLSRGVFLSRWGGLLAKLGVVRFALDLLMSGFSGLPKAISKASSGRGSSVTERLVGEVSKLPPEVWPMVRSHWCLPKSFTSMADYLEQIPFACALSVDDAPLTHIPVTVISGETSAPAVIEEHRRIASCSPQGRHIVAERSGHWVQLDRPDLVTEAVRDLRYT